MRKQHEGMQAPADGDPEENATNARSILLLGRVKHTRRCAAVLLTPKALTYVLAGY